MIVQACLNGARPASFHPRLPATPAAIVADAVEVVSAGAHELHVHVRGEDGIETLAPDAVDRVVSGLRDRLPGTLIGISTGAWIEKDDDRRLALIESWRETPDYASVNLSERDAPAVCERLARRGVGIEAGLATVADAERYVSLGLARLSLRILIEIEEPDPAAAQALASRMIALLTEGGVRKPLLIHGSDATVWPFVERAARDRLSTRVGLEDGATLPDGVTAQSNAELVAVAAEIMAAG
jgi:uncharacterized protein (DUF849 family)